MHFLFTCSLGSEVALLEIFEVVSIISSEMVSVLVPLPLVIPLYLVSYLYPLAPYILEFVLVLAFENLCMFSGLWGNNGMLVVGTQRFSHTLITGAILWAPYNQALFNLTLFI